MKAVLTKNLQELGKDIYVARSFKDRLRGLLGKKNLDPGQGMLICPCMGIHTFFMKFSIDAVFLDRNDMVIALVKQLAPNRMSAIYRRAHSVLELPSGTLDSAIAIGDHIKFT